jgi:hypothetical protein
MPLHSLATSRNGITRDPAPYGGAITQCGRVVKWGRWQRVDEYDAQLKSRPVSSFRATIAAKHRPCGKCFAQWYA